MRLACHSCSLLVGFLLIAASAARADDRAGPHVYGAPIQPPIVGRKAHSRTKTSTSAPAQKSRSAHRKSQRNELDEPL